MNVSDGAIVVILMITVVASLIGLAVRIWIENLKEQ